MSALSDQNAIILKTFTVAEIKKVSETAHESLFTPATGKKFIVRGFVLVSAVACVLVLEDGTTAFLPVPLTATSQVPVNVVLPGAGYTSTIAGNKLQAKVQEVTATGVSGFIYGNETY